MGNSQTDAARCAARPNQALRTVLRGAETVFLLFGAVCLLAYAGACARASLTQSRESAAFDEALRTQERLRQIHQESPNPRDWSPARVARYRASLDRPVRALGRLEIPDAELSVMVLEGTDEATLDRAVGRIEETAQPGEPGNLGIAGHRDGYFRALRHLQRGDAISLTTLDGVARYRVEKLEVVRPERVDVLESTGEPLLTLVTCYPFYYIGDAPKRFVVQARRVAYEPWPSGEAGRDLAAR